MARPKKQTVDYFPHNCKHGKTMFILEQKYGNDGYAFWFKLLELLGSTEGHYLKLENPADWEYLTATTRLEGETCEEILNLLSKLEAIDPEAWEQRIVWSDNFIENIREAYRNRVVDIPNKPDFLRKKMTYKGVSDVRNPQMKVDEMKEVYPVNGAPTIQAITDLYHNLCPSLPSIRALTDKRKKQIKARLKKYPSVNIYQELFKKAEDSDFLSGRNGKFTSCNIDWLLNENNMMKVLEGNYDNRGSPQSKNVTDALRLVEKYSREEDEE